MKRFNFLWIVLILGLFLSNLYSAGITIPSEQTQSTIDESYEENLQNSYGVYVEGDNFIKLIFTKNAIGNVGTDYTGDNSRYAYGVYSERDTNIIEHSGNMTVGGESNSYYWAYGIYVDDEGNLICSFNSGNINVNVKTNHDGSANGIYTSGDIVIFLNSGSINVNAETVSYADAYVISSSGSIYDFENSGIIEGYAKAIDGNAYAIGLESAYGDIIGFTNKGTINLLAEGNNAYAYGLLAGEYCNIKDVLNSGNIIVSTKGIYSAESYGFFARESIGGDNLISEEGNIENVKNTGNINVSATGIEENEYTRAYGFYAYSRVSDDYTAVASNGGNIINFENSGNINVSAYGEGYSVYAESYGFYLYSGASSNESYSHGAIIENFVNSGNINVSSKGITGEGESYSYAYGVYLESSSGTYLSFSTGGQIINFENSGNINVLSETTGDGSYGYGIYASCFSNYSITYWGGTITDFKNSGDINVQTTSSYDSQSFGIYTYSFVWTNEEIEEVESCGSNIDGLINEGNIIVKSTATEIYIDSDSQSYGIYAYSYAGSNESYTYSSGGNINNLENYGNIIAIANSGEYGYSYGIKSDSYAWSYDYTADSSGGNIENLTNYGNIITESNNNYQSFSYGIYAYSYSYSGFALSRSSGGNIENLTNYGNIIAESNSSTLSYSYGVFACSESITSYGSSENSGGNINNLTNYGNIITNATAGTYVETIGVYGNTILDLSNYGVISVNPTLTNSEGMIYAFGIKGKGSSDLESASNIVNTGLIEVKANAPEGTSSGSSALAGIFIEDGYVNITSPGEIRIESNVPVENARTLWIAKGTVNLVESFGITFGTPGTNPETRPIFVGENAVLNLNDANLVAYADSRNLQLNTEYFIIENFGGTVNGNWGDVEKGFSNESFDVNWVDSKKDAIIFTYDPTGDEVENVVSPVMGGIAGSPIIVSSIAGQLTSYNPLNIPLMSLNSERKPILLAQASTSDSGIPGVTTNSYYKNFWIMPVYTHIEGDNLGFDANAYGVALGFGGKVSDVSSFGVYAGYIRGDLDFKVPSADFEKQDIFVGGIDLAYTPKPWQIRFSGLGYYTSNDYTGFTGLDYDILETANYNTYGCLLETLLGYEFKAGKTGKIIIEGGIGYHYNKTDSFQTVVEENPSLERVFEPESKGVFKAIAGISAVGNVSSSTKFYGSARVEHAITNNDISIIYYIPGDLEYESEVELGNTTVVLQTGFLHSFNKNWNLEFNLRGDINRDYNAFTGRIFLRYKF